MPHPLPPNVDWYAEPEYHVSHFKRRCVAMAEQVTEQRAVAAFLFIVRDASGLKDIRLVPIYSHQSNPAIAADFDFTDDFHGLPLL
jgi:hypothetical protein